MARQSLCATLLTGQDAVCEAPKRRYYQQAVIINRSDIDTFTINKTDYDIPLPVCSYTVAFALKEGKKGFFFQGPENGNNYFGSFDKSTSDLGFVQYKHNVSMLVIGASEEAKCILESLDKGSYLVALQFTDGTVEVYGFQNGISTGDYTYDVQGGGGGAAIVLTSNDNTPEGYLPLIYVSAVPGSETEDFDSAFENIV